MKQVFVFFLILFTAPILLFSQGRVADEEFGKNRVQYHNDFNNWWRYESDNVITYWYGKGRNVAEVVFQLAEYDYEEIQNSLQHRMNEKLEIIVYTDITDLKQSNIGEEEQFITQTGHTRLVENKVFVYFNGSHTHLRKQIREGMTRAFIDQMIFGTNLQEMIQSAVSVEFPIWFKEGLISHMGASWHYEDDSRLRDLFYNSQTRSFEDMIVEQPNLTGKAFWHYISMQYGRATIANLLYLTRINRNLENGFTFILGKSFEQLQNECFMYFDDIYREEKPIFYQNYSFIELPGFSNKRNAHISDISLHPNQAILVYNENEIGRNKVFLHHINTGNREVLFREGFRNPFQDPDYNYPKLRWSPDGSRLMIIYEQRDIIKLREYDTQSWEYQEQEINPIFQRIYSFDYYDRRTLVMAATTDGFSDVYFYDLPTRQSRRFTQDIYDHKWVGTYEHEGKKGIVFSSNRQRNELVRMRRDTILPLESFDLFFLDPENDGHAIPLSQSSSSDEQLIRANGNDYFYFISSLNGVKNLYRMRPEFGNNSLQQFDEKAVSNLAVNIQTYDISNDLLFIVKEKGGVPGIYFADISAQSSYILPSTTLKAKNHGEQQRIPQQRPLRQFNPEDIREEFKFQTDFEDPDNFPFSEKTDIDQQETIRTIRPSQRVSQRNDQKKVQRFISARAIASRLHFRFEEVTTSLDNSILFSGLDAYAGIQEGFDFPPLGILIKSRVLDIFEDYVFEGGVRIQTNFNGAEYFLTFDDKKTRWNKRYAFYWRSRSDRQASTFGSFDQIKNTTGILQNRWTYPFDIFRSVRFTGTLRLDRFIYQSTSLESLEQPDFNRQSFGLRAEYVFDNSYDVMINIKNGSRYKFYIEGVNQFRVQFSPWAFDASSGFMTVIGFDARHYQRLLKHAVIAIRGAGATSLGSERILFYMGGVENWFSPGFNQNIPIPQDEKFAYQGMALNMRGFDQNIRNGSSFLVGNTELRIPVFHYFGKRPPRSDFLNSFQVIGFFDVGYSWYGSDPFGGQNPLNNIIISNPVSTAEVEYFRDPVVFGMGYGIRANVFGYFLRVDRGYGVETRQFQSPKWHFSMGFDF